MVMTISELRASRNWSLEEFARELGLSSKGHASDIEQGKAKCSVRVALELERISQGALVASELNADVALVRASGEAA